jgi:hypothetical protein
MTLKSKKTARNLTISYPAASMPFTLVDIALVDVVVPFDAVQNGCSADSRDLR